MGGANLTIADTFRLAGSKMRDHIEIRVQEYPHRKIIVAIFKRMVTNESTERCGKYENARGYFFGDKLGIMEGNPEELPCVKGCRSSECDNLTGAIGRRIIRNSSKPKFARERDVSPTKGHFLKINRDRMGSFLTDPYARYLMWAKVLSPPIQEAHRRRNLQVVWRPTARRRDVPSGRI